MRRGFSRWWLLIWRKGRKNVRGLFLQAHSGEYISPPSTASRILEWGFCCHLAESHSIASQRTGCLKCSCQGGNPSLSHLPSANTLGRFVLKGECPITCLCWSHPREVSEGKGGSPRVKSFQDRRSRCRACCLHTLLCVFQLMIIFSNPLTHNWLTQRWEAPVSTMSVQELASVFTQSSGPSWQHLTLNRLTTMSSCHLEWQVRPAFKWQP